MLRVPPVTLMSDSVKVVKALLRVKVKLPVSPMRNALSSVPMVTVGVTVSTVMFNGVAAVLLLPAASVKVSAATFTMTAVVLFAVGVKVAV